MYRLLVISSISSTGGAAIASQVIEFGSVTSAEVAITNLTKDEGRHSIQVIRLYGDTT